MKGLKYLIMLMMVATALPSMADDTTGGDAALGEKNGCGGDSTCGECVIQGTGDKDTLNLPPGATVDDEGNVIGL